MGIKPEKFEWNGQAMTLNEIAELEGVSYGMAHQWVWVKDYKGTADLPKGSEWRRGAKGKKDSTVVSSEKSAPEIPKALILEDIHVTIRPDSPMYKMLNWLAKSSNTSHDLAFCELATYLLEGHTIGEESHEIIKQRLIERHEGQNMDAGDYAYTGAKVQLTGLQERILAYAQELEAELINLREFKRRVLESIGG